MTAAHIGQVLNIEEDCFAIPWTKGDFMREAANERAIYFVAAIKGDIVGYGGMWHIVNEGHITNVAVDQRFRRLGIGRSILQALIDEAKRLKMIGMTLEVRMSNTPAQKLYTSFGFKPEGFRKNYYYDTKEDAIIMWLYF